MKNAKLVGITIERFKSFKEPTRIELAPLTIILGRNNSGKSTLIQSLLLLKQTLGDLRPAVMVRLEGVVDAFSLRELTFGWPPAADTVAGPKISIEWECDVDVKAALNQPHQPDLANLAKHSGVTWLKTPPDRKALKTEIKLQMVESGATALITSIELRSLAEGKTTVVQMQQEDGRWSCHWDGQEASKLEVEIDHFIPYLRVDRNELGPRDRQRAWHNAYLVLFAQPLEALKKILGEMQYLGSGRLPPPSLF
jgi:hypothetical protein